MSIDHDKWFLSLTEEEQNTFFLFCLLFCKPGEDGKLEPDEDRIRKWVEDNKARMDDDEY